MSHTSKRKSNMADIRFLLLLTTMYCWIPSQVFSTDLTASFSMMEEVNIGKEVGNLGDDSVLPLNVDPQVRGSLRYSLIPQGSGARDNDLFRVDEASGKIFTRSRIDREQLCGFDATCDVDLQMAVQSAVSQFFKTVTVTVRIEDKNDNPPTFIRPTMELHVLESVAIGTSFALETATDLDVGEFGVKGYEISPNTGPFYLNVTKTQDGSTAVNLVVRHELDRETVPEHSLSLMAFDGGVPSQTGSAAIVVKIDDVNDRPPTFDHSIYNVSLPETATPGTHVVRVRATDLDTPPFGVKEYRFSPLDRDDVTKLFAIDANTGEITVVGSLLEKQGMTFRLRVECLDKGLPPLISRTEVDVTVEDTTNSAPIITLSLMFGGVVSEVAQPGRVVALLSVEDRDDGMNGIVACTIVSDAFDLHTLNINVYKVIVVKQLDRESEPVHNVSVTCTDAGQPPLMDSRDFLIKVSDENDNTPYFEKFLYEKEIEENTKAGEILLRVSAKDDDIGDNGLLNYSLVDADPILRIDSRGNILAVEPLDYEKTKQYKFKVMASDNGVPQRSTTADVKITVIDQNDITPKFTHTVYSFKVLENKPGNTTVDNVIASDNDTGLNGDIVYSLHPQIYPFRILPNGEIVTKEKLDREQVPMYSLTVHATDKGSPPNTGTAIVKIQIVDQNDHSPRIVFPASGPGNGGNSTVSVPFNTKPGVVVLSIVVEDEDEGDNKRLHFHLAGSSGSSLFTLDQEKGDLILTRELTETDTGRHRLTVVVTDRSPTHPLASNTTFEVIISTPNATASPGKDREKEHVMVVIILGVVTGVVTVAVIITIVVIRRADMQRRKYMARNPSGKSSPPEVEKLEAVTTPNSGYVISNSVDDGTKGGKGGHEDFSRDVTQDEGFADKSFSTSQGSSGPVDQSDWSKALRLHQDLLKLHGVDPAFLVQGAQGDDVTSDGSGESTTCDSGRGGSEEDNGSHGRASPVHKGTQLNNLNQPPRPVRAPGRAAPNIPRSSGLSTLTGRQLASSLDARYPPTTNSPNGHPTGPTRSLSVPPPVKHVSFRDDIIHDWPELLPPHPRGQGQGQGQNKNILPMTLEETWGNQRMGGPLQLPQRHPMAGKGVLGELSLSMADHSFDTAEDGASTTTSGSYTVDDLSPRTINCNYAPETAVV